MDTMLFLLIVSFAICGGAASSPPKSDAECMCPPDLKEKALVCGSEMKSDACFKNRAYSCPIPGKPANGTTICWNSPCTTDPGKQGIMCTSHKNYAKQVGEGKKTKCEDCFIREDKLKNGENLDWTMFGEYYLILKGDREEGKVAEVTAMKRDGDKFAEA